MKYLVSTANVSRPEMVLSDYPFYSDRSPTFKRGQILQDEDTEQYYAVHSEVGIGRLADSPEEAIRVLLEVAECTDIEVTPSEDV